MEHEDALHRPKSVYEEQTHNSSSTGRDCAQNCVNGRHPKKKKEKEKPVRIQQRGLGVAELEKLRRLEEQKNKGDLISSTPVHRLNTPLQANNLYNRSGSVPLQPPFVTQSPNHVACNNYYPYFPSNPHLNVGHQSATQFNSAGPGTGFPTTFFETEGNESNHTSSEYARDLEILTRSELKANASDGPIQQRTSPIQLENLQSYFYSPSTVNQVAASSSSAVLNFQTEPPSNQSLLGTYRSVQPDEAEKVYFGLKSDGTEFLNKANHAVCFDVMRTVGSKRQHLLSPQDSQARCKHSPFSAHSLGRSNSFGTDGAFAISGNPSLRESLPCSVSMPNLQLRKDSRIGCATSDGGFLKLGPPETMSLLSSLKSKPKPKQALSHAGTHQQADLPNTDSTTYQVRTRCSNSQCGSSIPTDQQQQQQGSYPTFEPAPNNVQDSQSTVLSNHDNGETEDNLDLSLKL